MGSRAPFYDMLRPAKQFVLFAIARALRPRPPTTVSAWAESNMRLSSKQTAAPGRFRIDRNPALQEPMDCMSARSAVSEVVCCFPIQFGKSTIETAVIGYSMTENPGPIMACLPGEVSMKKFIVQKINPLVEETPVVREVLTATVSRDARNTQDFKDFAGGQLYIEHAGNPKRLKSTSVKILLVDEFTEFAASMQSGDDPVELLRGRTSAFPAVSKAMYVSTPGIKGLCRTTEKLEASDHRRRYLPCPHCGELHAYEWPDLHWSLSPQTGRVARAWLVCPECGCEIEEHYKPAMLAAGRWISENPGHPVRGYRANCLYYPIGLGPRWPELAQMWLDAQGDPAKLKTFINDRLAEAWEDPSLRALKQNLLAERAEPYDLRVAPLGVCYITAGIDTQDDRLEVHLIGWGRGMASWTLDYVVLPGDPARPEVWAALTALLNRPIQHAGGAKLRVAAAAVDGRGHRTPFVKAWALANQDSVDPVQRPMVIFGAKANNAPVLGRPKWEDIKSDGKTEKRGLHTWQVGTVAAKHWLFRRLGADADLEREQRLVHFSDQLDKPFFAGMVAETFDPKTNRYLKKRGARNEPLDTYVYAYAAAHHPELHLHRLTRAEWTEAEARLARNGANQPAAEGAPATGQPAAPAAPSAQVRRRTAKSTYLR
jgi:phage terminase large subunit GpA-like protein